MSKSQNQLLNAALAARSRAAAQTQQPKKKVKQRTPPPRVVEDLGVLPEIVDDEPVQVVEEEDPIAGPIAAGSVDDKLVAKLVEAKVITPPNKKTLADMDAEDRSAAVGPLTNIKSTPAPRRAYTGNLIECVELQSRLQEDFSKVQVGTDTIIVSGPTSKILAAGAETTIELIKAIVEAEGITAEVTKANGEGRYRVAAI